MSHDKCSSLWFCFCCCCCCCFRLTIVYCLACEARGKVVPYFLLFPYNPQLTAAFFRSLIIIANTSIIHNIENNRSKNKGINISKRKQHFLTDVYVFKEVMCDNDFIKAQENIT